jgi:agmatine/peptidylarginine deiminase
MFAKIISPSKILLSQAPTSSGNYAILERANSIFQAAKNAKGEKFEVIRLPAGFSSSALTNTYTNSLIVNKKVCYLSLHRTLFPAKFCF